MTSCDACGDDLEKVRQRFLFEREPEGVARFCGPCVARGGNRLHAITHPHCRVDFHDVWDRHQDQRYAYALAADDAEDRMMTRHLTGKPAPYTPHPDTAGALVAEGFCSGACLVADEDRDGNCACKCGGKFHGALAFAPLTLDATGITAARDPLEGQYFHAFKTEDDGCKLMTRWGRVIGLVTSGLYLVEENHANTLAPLSDMNDWHFYHTKEDMNFMFEYGRIGATLDQHARWHVRDAASGRPTEPSERE